MDFILIAILIGIVGIIYGLVLAKVVLSYKVTDKNMLRISSAIYKGAMAFLKKRIYNDSSNCSYSCSCFWHLH